MLVAAMLVLGICLGALIAVAAYATELKRIARFLRTRDVHSNARVTSGTPAPGLRDLAEAVNAELDQASRERIAALRSQEEFQRDLSALSHDIRTPLTGAKGYLQLARDERDAAVRDRHLGAASARTRMRGAPVPWRTAFVTRLSKTRARASPFARMVTAPGQATSGSQSFDSSSG